MVKKPYLLLVVLMLVNACGGVEKSPLVGTVAAYSDFVGQLRQVSDYPFYELHYSGDYGFADFLEEGLSGDDLAAAPTDSTPFACSAFAAFGNLEAPLFGRNFDWDQNPALILFTDSPDGYASVSMVDISYLGYDRDFTPLQDPEGLRDAPYLPFDGMNEHGLAVGMMAVGHAEGGADPAKVTLDELQIIRVLLDYARDVGEALELMDDFNIDFGSVPIHYFLADRGGSAVVVEYLYGVPQVIPMRETWMVSTNFLLSEERPSGADSSCGRYNYLWRSLSDAGGRVSGEGAMRLLEEVAQDTTRWSVIYNLSELSAQAAINQDYRHLYDFVLD